MEKIAQVQKNTSCETFQATVIIRPEFTKMTQQETEEGNIKFDPKLSALFNHILFWVAKRHSKGKKYWYSTAKEICDQIQRLCGVTKLRQYIDQLVEMKLISKCENPNDSRDQTYHFYFADDNAKKFARLLKKHKIDVSKIGLPVEVLQMLVDKKAISKNDACKDQKYRLHSSNLEAGTPNLVSSNTKSGVCYKEPKTSTKTSPKITTKKEEDTGSPNITEETPVASCHQTSSSSVLNSSENKHEEDKTKTNQREVVVEEESYSDEVKVLTAKVARKLHLEVTDYLLDIVQKYHTQQDLDLILIASESYEYIHSPRNKRKTVMAPQVFASTIDQNIGKLQRQKEQSRNISYSTGIQKHSQVPSGVYQPKDNSYEELKKAKFEQLSEEQQDILSALVNERERIQTEEYIRKSKERNAAKAEEKEKKKKEAQLSWMR